MPSTRKFMNYDSSNWPPSKRELKKQLVRIQMITNRRNSYLKYPTSLVQENNYCFYIINKINFFGLRDIPFM